MDLLTTRSPKQCTAYYRYTPVIGLRPSVSGYDRSETKKNGLGLDLAHCGLGLAGLVL